jgi:hypothetical protein
MIRARTLGIKHKDQIESTKRKTLGLKQEYKALRSRAYLIEASGSVTMPESKR